MRNSVRRISLFVLSLLISLGVPAQESQGPVREPDIFYLPTPPEVIDAMLKIAKVGPKDIVYDLGSGDGRIVIAAARDYGATGIGIDIDPKLVSEATENAKQNGVADKVRFVEADLFTYDFSEATVVTLYLLTELNIRLKPKLLAELKPGTRIVSHAFDMGDWEPVETLDIDGRKVYFWIIPEPDATNN